MSVNQDQVKRIQDKLQQLLKQHGLLQKENQSLKTELNKSRKELLEHQVTVDGLKQQAEILKYSHTEMDPLEKKQFEKRINTYLKEIDRCITMLSE